MNFDGLCSFIRELVDRGYQSPDIETEVLKYVTARELASALIRMLIERESL